MEWCMREHHNFNALSLAIECFKRETTNEMVGVDSVPAHEVMLARCKFS